MVGLTSYPREPILRSHVNPRRERTAGTAARHSRFADPAHADFRAAARTGHRARHPTNLRRRTARRTWRALSRAAEAGGARMDFREVGNLVQQSQGAVLFAYRAGPQTTREGNHEMEAAGH